MLFYIYLACLAVGGLLVLLSIFGGDADMDADFDADFDLDVDVDAGGGILDLFSLRALTLFAAFFGLTGTLLSLTDASWVFTLITAAVLGAAIALGGNAFIERVGKAHVSSEVTEDELVGATAKVLIPFEGGQRGKISLIAGGSRMNLVAASFEEAEETFGQGDEVVVVRMQGSVAEIVKPD